MKKTVKLTESDLSRIVQRVINEQPLAKAVKPLQPKKVDLGVPIDNPFWEELSNWVMGEGPEVMEYIPNKKLVIGVSDGYKLVPDYTIIKH